MEKARQEQAIIALKEKGATQPCPRCRNLEFEVIGDAMVLINENRNDVPAIGVRPVHPGVPVILVSCTNCGYIAHHATGVLGIARQP